MKTPKIPKTDSIKELAEFWETHDFTDFEDQMERVRGPLFEGESFIRVHLDPRETKFVKGVAKSKRVKESEVIREWIREKLRTA